MGETLGTVGAADSPDDGGAPPIPGNRAAPAEASPPAPAEPPAAFGYVLALAGLLALIITFRVAGPSDLHAHGQPETVAYSVDAAVNDAWLIQREPDGTLATQPPMYAWWGGAAIRLLGRTDPWVLKLPSLAAAAITLGVVVLLARRYVGGAAACVAAAAWLANPLAFKLIYIARPDMLLAMWLAVALLAAVRQREGWEERRAKDEERREKSEEGDSARSSLFPLRSSLPWIILFWLAVIGGLLTAGPVALIAVAFLLGLVVYDRAWKASRPGWQGAAAIVGLGLAGGWLYAVLQGVPEGWETLGGGLFERFTGKGEPRPDAAWDLPLDFLGRWTPWSVLFLLGWALVLVHGRRLSGRLGWTVAWAAIVLGALLLQPGGRTDSILPALAGAAVLVAVLLAWISDRPGGFRGLVHFLLCGVGAVGLSCSILVWLAPRLAPAAGTPGAPGAGIPGAGMWAEHVFIDPPPGPDYERLVWVTAAVAVAAGVSTLVLLQRRNYLGGAMAAGFVMAGVLGFFHVTWDGAATDRTGDTILTVVAAARAMAADAGGPAVAYEVGETPVAALLGQAGPMDASALDRLGDGGGAVIAGAEAWAAAPEPWRQRGRAIALTPELGGSNLALLLVEMRPAEVSHSPPPVSR